MYTEQRSLKGNLIDTELNIKSTHIQYLNGNNQQSYKQYV